MLKRFAFAALAASIALSGCASVASTVSSVVVSATTSSATQATTVAEAAEITALIEKSLDIYVQSGAASPAILKQLQILVPAVHNTLVAVEKANANGNSATVAAALAAFNQALAAVNSYETLQGIAH